MKNKRAFIAAVLSAMLVTAGFPAVASAAENEVLLGDVNGDGKVDVTDATTVQMIVAELTKVSDARMKAADVNGDGDVNITDVTLIQQYAAEISTDFPIGEPIETETQPATEVTTEAATTEPVETTTEAATTEPVETTTEAAVTEPTETTTEAATTEPVETTTAPVETTTAQASTEAVEPTTAEVNEDAWKENTGVITLSNSGITVTGEGIEVVGNIVYITEGGDWEVVGTCDDGMIYVNTSEEKDANDKVKLRLNGMSLTNTNGPAIYFDRCKKAFITFESGTVNTVSDSAAYAEEYADAKGAVHSDDSLEIKGKGTLVVNGNYKHGIASSDDIVIENGVFNITAVKDGLHANDYIVIDGKNISITADAKGDGIESEGNLTVDKAALKLTGGGKGLNAADYITLTSGTFVIDTTDDCINSNAAVTIEGGSYDLKSGDDGITGLTIDINGGTFELETTGKGINGDGTINLNADTTYVISSTDDCVNGNADVNIAAGAFTLTSGDEAVTGDTINISGGVFGLKTAGKGVKATTDMTVTGGTFTIDSTDDAVHSNGNITVKGGEFTINSGDDGVHADTTLTIEDGTITVSKSYEGLEANDIIISGGTINVTASDDAINAAGGQDQSSQGGRPGQNSFRPGSTSSNSSITINGGYVFVAALGDGVDSNGSLAFNGGTTVVQGPSNGGNFAIDADGTVGFNGGTVMAVCSSSAMWQDITGKLGNAVYTQSAGSVSSGSVIAVTDASGNVLSAVKSKLSGNVGVLYYSGTAGSLTSCKSVTGGTYSGSFDSFGYAEGGTISGGTSANLGQSSSGGFQPGGPGGRR